MSEMPAAFQQSVAAFEAIAARAARFESAHGRPPSCEELLGPQEPAMVEAIERAPVGVALHRMGACIYLNPSAALLLGDGGRGALLGRSLLEFLHFDSRDDACQQVVPVGTDARGAAGSEFKLLRPDGRVVEVVGTALLLDDAGTVLTLFIDVSAGRRAERRLRELESRYRLIAEHAEDLIAEFDASGRLVFVSPNHEQVLGYRPEELLGRAPFELVHPDDREALAATMQSRGPQVLLQRTRHKDGGYLWVEVRTAPYQTEQGDWHALGVSRDVTARVEYQERLEAEVQSRTAELERANDELRRLQAELVASQSLGVLQDGTERVMHALLNPLAALMGTLELAQESREGDPVFERVQALARRIRGVVDRSHALFSEGRLRLEPVPPDALLRELCDALETRAKAQGVRIEQRAGDDLPAILGDPTWLSRALFALGVNALDAMPGGGTLLLDAEPIEELGVLVLHVRDTGPGVTPEALERAFEPFFSTRGGAAGLGLAIARGVVNGHRGRLRLSNHTTGGALATVELPTVEGPFEAPLAR